MIGEVFSPTENIRADGMKHLIQASLVFGFVLGVNVAAYVAGPIAAASVLAIIVLTTANHAHRTA